jgi:hypothetical protein
LNPERPVLKFVFAFDSRGDTNNTLPTTITN